MGDLELDTRLEKQGSIYRGSVGPEWRLWAPSGGYPAAQWAHPWPAPFRAASLDLAVTIHDPGAEGEWLLVDAEAPVASNSLLGGRVDIWSEGGRLLASSVQQMLQLA